MRPGISPLVPLLSVREYEQTASKKPRMFSRALFLLHNFYLVQLCISFQHSALLNYITLFPVFQGNPKIFQKIEKSSHYSGSFILSYFFTKYSSYQTRNVYIVQILRQLSEFPFTYSRNIAFISSVSKNSAAVSLLNKPITHIKPSRRFPVS